MAGSESAEMKQLTEKEIYHQQARAGNKIKTTMVAIQMELNGLDNRRAELQRRYDNLSEALDLLKFAPLNIGKRELPERPSNHLGLCNEIPIHTPEQTPVTMSFNVEASEKFFGKDHIDNWPKSSIETPVQPVEQNTESIARRLHSGEKFNYVVMKGRDWFDCLNPPFVAFQQNVEGYWRNSVTFLEPEEGDKPVLPWPVADHIQGFDKDKFCSCLIAVERLAKRQLYRGLTMHRWTGVTLGNGEFWYKEWRWPDSYSVYVKDGVPPSRAFFQFIMKAYAENNPDNVMLDDTEYGAISERLPTYGR